MNKKIASLILLLMYVAVIVSSWDTLLTQNAAKYAQVSREILDSGDWINLTVGGEAYDQKPPLMFWIGAVFFKLFGVSDVVFRIAILLVSFLGVLATYKLGKLLYGRKTGWYAAIFWATCLGFIHFNNDVHTDTVLAAMVILAIWQLAVFLEEQNKVAFFAGMIFVGLAMLAKGPVGAVIPATAILIHLMLRKRWRDIFHPRWLLAIPILFIAILPALWGLYNQFGAEGIKFYFWTNNMGRITGSYYSRGNDFLFCFHTGLYVLAPFSIFAFIAAGKKIGQIFSKSPTSAHTEYYTLGGIIPFFLMLSVSQTQNPHYLLNIAPLFMILGASLAVQYADGKISPTLNKIIKWLNFVIALIFWVLIFMFVFWFYPEKNPVYWIVLAAFVVILVLFGWKLKGFRREMSMLMVSFFALMLSFHISFYQHMKAYNAPFGAVEYYNEYAKEGEEIHLYKLSARYWEMFFYGKDYGRYYEEESDFGRLIAEQRGDWVFTDEAGKNQLVQEFPNIEVHEYDHRPISGQTPQFLNPKTRASKLKKLYLLHLPK